MNIVQLIQKSLIVFRYKLKRPSCDMVKIQLNILQKLVFIFIFRWGFIPITLSANPLELKTSTHSLISIGSLVCLIQCFFDDLELADIFVDA